MKNNQKKILSISLSILILSILILGVFTISFAQAPNTIGNVILSINGDPTTCIGVTWHTDTNSTHSNFQLSLTNNFTSPIKEFTGVPVLSANSNVTVQMTDESVTPNVKYNVTNPAENLHKLKATGLQPNTTYYYRVGDATLNIWSATGTFKTAPTTGAFTFIDLADPQALDTTEAALAADTFSRAVSTVPNASFIAVNGDWIDTGSDEREWGWLFNSAPQVFNNKMIVPAVGNHEGDAKKISYKGAFMDHFNLDVPAGCDTSYGAYYSYDYINAHFVVLNTNDDLNSGTYNDMTDSQVTWMQNDITAAKANGQKWIIVILHKGPYSTSNHSTDSDIAGAKGVRTLIAPILANLGVDLVLQGHDHIYARSKPIKADGTAVNATTTTASFNGHNINYQMKPGAPVYLIPGTAGPKVYYKNKVNTVNFYNLFDKADENHAAIYGAAAGDISRPERSNIQNFESITINGNVLTVLSYEIDQNRNNKTPYIIDTFGIDKN